MTAKAGLNITIRVGDGAAPSETFTQLDGVQVSQFEIDRNAINAETFSSDGWQRLSIGGRRKCLLRLEGIWIENPISERVQTLALEGSPFNLEVVLGNAQMLRGQFLLRNYRQTAQRDAIITMQCELHSTGDLTLN